MNIVDRDKSANAPDWDEHLHCFSKQQGRVQVHSPVPGTGTGTGTATYPSQGPSRTWLDNVQRGHTNALTCSGRRSRGRMEVGGGGWR